MMARLRLALFVVIFVAVLWFVLSRVNIVVFVQASPWTLLAFIGVTSVVVFLVVDHLINRTR